jgi:eukaryotic-like serine/threonine-protein kinase
VPVASFQPTLPCVDADVTRSDDVGLPTGTHIGRFVVEGLLGKGAMGVVYRASDPELGRPVALKCVRLDQPQAQGAQERLRREARAMAQLSDSNVVGIHDLVVHEGHLYIAMELVDGMSLAAWLGETSRGWREILEAFVQAGRGLAAAHEVGLVHRDFKPENVLRSRRGRVCVTDFGLACPSGKAGSAESDLASEVETGGEHASGERWVTSREIAGTPDYMSPEQARGEPVDARSDQFSFCVALYEALYGEDPLRCRVPLPPDPLQPNPVPSWLRKALLRGLRASPEERHESMDALLEELVREQDARPTPRTSQFSDPAVVRAWLTGPRRSAPPVLLTAGTRSVRSTRVPGS